MKKYVRTLEQVFDSQITNKAAENAAKDRRRIDEDEISERLNVVVEMDFSHKEVIGIHEVKVTGRLNKKVDSDDLQVRAAEAGVEAHLPSLFRWKPEVNMAAWKNTDPNITNPLLPAITSTPGRPSFQITRKEGVKV